MTIQRWGSIPSETILPTSDSINWAAFVPVFTGFSVDPGGEFRFCAFGDTVVVIVTMSTAGEGNNNIFTMTLPFVSNRAQNTLGVSMSYLDGGGGEKGPGKLNLPPGSNILELFTGPNDDVWKMSGTKRAHFTFIYERDFLEPTF